MKLVHYLLFGFAIVLGCAKHPMAIQAPGHRTFTPKPYDGPDSTTVDLLRTSEDGPRIFVQVTFPNGEFGLFMVDTGAAISTLSEKTAERLGLPLDRNYGSVEGLGGTSNFHRTTLPTLEIGKATVHEVEFAVGVRGVPEYAYFMPLDGILGNNVWAHFTLEVDYPADTLTLHRPGTATVPGKWTPMIFDGSHVFAEIGIETRGARKITDALIMEVDTGASELLLSGNSGDAFVGRYSEGVEPIYGIGASEYMPASMFLQTTRRIPVGQVVLGGQKIRNKLEAKWLNFESRGRFVGPVGMRGLIGHELLHRHAVWFDYAGSKFSLVKSKRKPRQINGHSILLAQDEAEFGDITSRLLYRAKLRFATDETERAIQDLRTFISANPEDSESRVLLAKVLRFEGDLDAAWDVLKDVPPPQLVEQDEIISTVNGLVLAGQTETAHQLAKSALDSSPLEASAHIAYSDALFALGQYGPANRALLNAAQNRQNPDANLLRRARISLAMGDRYGAMAKVRRLVHLYPTEGTFLWFYVTLLDDSLDRSTFEKDMNRALARLHPALRPFDFMLAAYKALDDDTNIDTSFKQGVERDCSPTLNDATKDNCIAWYQSLAGRNPADSLERITRALDEEGARSDFLDTKAMVHLARGELQLAEKSAVEAARLNPDDIYMLWQAERIAAMNTEANNQP